MFAVKDGEKQCFVVIKLHTSLTHFMKQYLNKNWGNKLSNDKREIKEELITYSELLKSFKRSKSNKSSGINGFTTKVYKFF